MANRQAFPIAPAKQIRSSQPVEPYFSPQQKKELEAHKREFKGSHKLASGPARASVKSSSYDMDDSDDSSTNPTSKNRSSKKRSSKKALPNPPERSGRSSTSTNKDQEEESKESKGLLSKVVDTAKSVVGAKQEKKKIVETSVVIELPRDILTAFFLLRLPRDDSRRKVLKDQEREPFWNDYSFMGKVYLWICVLMPYFVQWFVLIALLNELGDKWDELQQNEPGDFWWNTIAFAVLFLYMWKDLAQFYFSVWYYIAWLQSKRGGILSNLKDAAVAVKDVTVESTKERKGTFAEVKKEEKAKELKEEAVEETKTAIQFIEFKLWLISVVFLYIGLTCYSLLSIPFEESLVDKLEISLSIFFVLEVDDWAYELFIAQANILEDEEFDVVIKVKKDRKGVVKQQEGHLLKTILLVMVSTFGFWILGWALHQIPGDAAPSPTQAPINS
eukprot:24482_1